ncbi:MAG: hypothetical protein KAH54_07570 [Candidatus Sabulitectum sp.]|nr:hypothetical protein [Candidatus Sabulitectum sp.]
MKRLSVSFISIILLLVIAGTALGEREEITTIELTEDQIAIIVHNCPRGEEITIELTEDQIAIIIHDFPQVMVEEITIGTEHISSENTIDLTLAGRAGVAPIESR